MSKLKYLLANKYILASFIFFIWLMFFDKNNLITIYQLDRSINELKKEQKYYTDEQALLDGRIHSIEVDRERYAREKFYLHKSNETVYLIR